MYRIRNLFVYQNEELAFFIPFKIDLQALESSYSEVLYSSAYVLMGGY